MTTDRYIETKREILSGSGKMERVIPIKYKQEHMHALINNVMRAVVVDKWDYGFKAGDDLLLKGVTFDDTRQVVYTGDWVLANVTHVLDDELRLEKGAACLSIKLITFGTADNWKQFKNIKDHLINESA